MTHTFTDWRKSRRSEPDEKCVEIAAAADGTIGVRDSKDARGPVLEFDRTEWARFVERLTRS